MSRPIRLDQLSRPLQRAVIATLRKVTVAEVQGTDIQTLVESTLDPFIERYKQVNPYRSFIDPSQESLALQNGVSREEFFRATDVKIDVYEVNAEVQEDTQVQVDIILRGSVNYIITPSSSIIYLNEALDRWMDRLVRKLNANSRLTNIQHEGVSYLIKYRVSVPARSSDSLPGAPVRIR